MGIEATVTFPGIAQIQSATIRQSHGVLPDSFVLTIAPQPSNVVLEIGDLTLEYNNQRLVFPDCRVDQASFRFDGGGQLVSLTILDRRWRWQLTQYREDGDRFAGILSGEYNVRREDGTLKKIAGGNPDFAIDNSERTPQQLAQLCLLAANEPIAPDALNPLPNDVRPYVVWDDANAMLELENLADLLGCRVVKGIDNVTRIRKFNQGRLLPEDGLISYGASADFSDAPDAVGVTCGYVRFQHDFELEAVGLDVDGSIKPIDDLSYKPADGWSNLALLSAFGVLDEEGHQNLAMRSVYRWYRVKVPFTLPIFGTVTRRDQIVLLGSQVFQEEVENIKQSRDAMVYGIWFRGNDALPDNSAEELVYLPDDAVENLPSNDARVAMIVRQGFSIDPDTHTVKFGDHVWKKNDDDLGWGPATLRLRTSCYVRYAETGEFVRYRKVRALRNVANPSVAFQRHDEIKRTVYAIYNNDFQITSIHENGTEADPEIEHYLSEAVVRYGAAKIPQVGVYAGWRFDVDLDGAIHSITWTLSATDDTGPHTVIERQHDTGGNASIPYRLRRRFNETAEANRRIALAKWREQQTRELARAGGQK